MKWEILFISWRSVVGRRKLVLDGSCIECQEIMNVFGGSCCVEQIMRMMSSLESVFSLFSGGHVCISEVFKA